MGNVHTKDANVCGAFSFLASDQNKKFSADALLLVNATTADGAMEEVSSPSFRSAMDDNSSCWDCRCHTNNSISGNHEIGIGGRTNKENCSTSNLPRTSSWFRDANRYTDAELALSGTVATPSSDLHIARCVWIVTTAALPWMTGTAVNPILRAAYLAQYKAHTVHLVVPWLEDAEDRVALYGSAWKDKTVEDQEAYLHEWVRGNVIERKNTDDTSATDTADTDTAATTDDPSQQALFQIHWYPARYHAALGSIFAMDDVCAGLESLVEPNAICLLEEPEHLNYYRGGHWRVVFAHVCGIIHTNYCQYAEQTAGSTLAVPLIGAVSAWMVRAYCDTVIQLSATLPAYAPEKEVVSNVHGVRDEFFQTYRPGENTVYFLGKLLWAKGLDKLYTLQKCYQQTTGQYFAMDVYGSGPDQDEIRETFDGSRPLLAGRSRSYTKLAAAATYLPWNEHREEPDVMPVTFPGRVDHAKLDADRECSYKIFVNPSVSEVLCTVSAEAIAMGKFVILPQHPSNTFFEQFPNCLLYTSQVEFCNNLQYALSHMPEPLGEHKAALTWDGATERLCQAAAISPRDAARRDRCRHRDQRLADWHIKMGEGPTGDALRTMLGAGPVAKQYREGTEKRRRSSSSGSGSSSTLESSEDTGLDPLGLDKSAGGVMLAHPLPVSC